MSSIKHRISGCWLGASLWALLATLAWPALAAPGTATFPFRANRSVWALLKRTPKIDTHDHLGGGMPRQAFKQICRRHGRDRAEVATLLHQLKPPYRDITSFLSAYRTCINSNLTTPEDFRTAAREIVKQAGRENVSFLSVRERLDGVGVAPERLLRAVEEGLREGARWVARRCGYSIGTGLIVAVSRSCDSQQSCAAARLTRQWAKRKGSLIIGFDVAGDEAQHPIKEHAAACRIISSAGLPLTVHAGETPGSGELTGEQSIAEAIGLGAVSVGHGRFAARPALRSLFRAGRTPRRAAAAIEACPVSNEALGYVSSLADHPFRGQLRKGLNVNLGTDDPLFFTASRHPFTEQLYQLWASGQLTSWNDVKRVVRNGYRWPLIPAARRIELQARLEGELRAIEADPRFARTIARYFTPE